MNGDWPQLVAVATGCFIRVPEKQVSEVHLIIHLKEEALWAMGLKVMVLLLCFQRKNLFTTKNCLKSPAGVLLTQVA